MRDFTDAEILDRVSKLPSFHGFPAGVMDVWVRSRADAYDQFDDKVFTYFCIADGARPKFIMAGTGTTNAGSFGLMNWRTYNPKGCAVLKSDVIVYKSHVYGLHKGKPAYVQNPNAPFPYHRDGDNDRRAEESGETYWDLIGANCHRAGTFSSVILNWSIGCLVRNQLSQFMAWLGYMKSNGYPPLSVAILKEF